MQPEHIPPRERQAEDRIVVTGIGLVTPLGIGVAPFWQGLATGRSAIGPATLFNADDLACGVAAEVPSFEPQLFMESKEARKLSRASQFAVAAARMALNDAAMVVNDQNRYEIGVLIANSSTSPPEIEISTKVYFERGPSRINPFHFAASLPHMPACQVTIQLGLLGHSSAIGTACAAGAQAIGEAAEIIRRGDANVTRDQQSAAASSDPPTPGRLHQRPCNQHAAWRYRRDASDQTGLWRKCIPGANQLDQVDDWPPDQRRWSG